MAQGDRTLLGTETKVQLGLLGGIFIAAVAGSWQAARWGSAIEHQLTDLVTDIGQVDRRLVGIEGQLAVEREVVWTKQDMAVWVSRLRELNPDTLKIPQ